MTAIEIGMYARYKNTGTVGKVLEIMEEDGITFALLDSTDLFYDITYLEQAEKPREKKAVTSDIDTSMRTAAELQDALASGEMSENIGGG